jgi:hypothetical protein
VLAPHAYAREFAIGTFLCWGQLALARLFFGWQISATRGA